MDENKVDYLRSGSVEECEKRNNAAAAFKANLKPPFSVTLNAANLSTFKR